MSEERASDHPNQRIKKCQTSSPQIVLSAATSPGESGGSHRYKLPDMSKSCVFRLIAREPRDVYQSHSIRTCLCDPSMCTRDFIPIRVVHHQEKKFPSMHLGYFFTALSRVSSVWEVSCDVLTEKFLTLITLSGPRVLDRGPQSFEFSHSNRRRSSFRDVQ